MLPGHYRMRRREEFTTAVRRGRRAGRATLVIHLFRGEAIGAPPRVGFVVSRAVGNAVVRNRVQRQLRHLMRDRLDRLPYGSLVVVRAQRKAADATSGDLGADVDRALHRLLGQRAGKRER